MKKEYLMGIDMGTSSVKVGLFDLQGHEVASHSEPYPLYTPRSGWAEQDINDWWNAICISTRKIFEENPIDPASIVSLSADTTGCTVIFADEDMNVVRPALLWMDARASKEAKELTATGDAALVQNGGTPVSAESMPAKALWVKKNEPETYKKAAHVFECIDWLMYRLTGELNGSLANAAPRWYYNPVKSQWPTSFYESGGLGDLLDKFPEHIIPIGTKIGRLQAQAASDLGLPEGIVVGEGGLDAFVGMVGLGVTDTEKLALITGTSHLVLGLTEKETHAEGIWGSYLNAVVPGLQMVEGGQIATGGAVSWFKNHFAGEAEKEAQRTGKSIYQVLNERAEQLSPGADGLLVLDYFQGNRNPYADADVRGMIYGLSLNHTAYHMYRAIIEGICYGTELILEKFRTGGAKPGRIRIAGGAVHSRFWVQAHADISNTPIEIPEITEAPCLGSAILGAIAAGVYPDIATAVDNMVHIREVITPDENRHSEYMKYYKNYVRCYKESKDWMHSVTENI